MKKILFVKTFDRDLHKLEQRLVRSLVENNFWRAFDECVFVTEAEYWEAAQKVTLRVPNARCLSVSAFWPEALNIANGYARQQYIKVSVHEIAGPDEVFYVTDSDCWFKPHMMTEAMLRLEPPVLNVVSLEEAGRFNISFREAAAATRALLKLVGDPVFDFTAYPFWPLLPSATRGLHTFLNNTHGKPAWQVFEDAWQAGQRFSEFNVYGEYVRQFHAGSYVLNNILDPPQGFQAPFVWYYFVAHKHAAPVRLSA